jgi:hypothetical protein
MLRVFMQQHAPAELFGSALLAKTDAFFALWLATQPEQKLLRLSQNPRSKR